jgi:NDP-sugar pyrophosphorylase family protein
MQAIILSAGYGTRLQPLSHHLPKPLMPVLGKPLLLHTIMKLTASKATRIGINTHHHAAMIKSCIEAHNLMPQVFLSHEETIQGSGGGINGFRKFIGREGFFIVCNGDVLSSIPLEPLVAAFQKKRSLCALVLQDHPAYNNVLIDDEGNILDMRDMLKPGTHARRLAYTGIAIMDSRIFKYLPSGFSDIIEVLVNIIQEGSESVTGIVADGHAWSDIGTVRTYLETHHAILVNRKALVSPGLMPEGPTFFGQGTILENNVQLNGFISAGCNCLLKKGCSLENCVIWDNAVINENAVFKNAVIGNGWTAQAEEL